MYALLQIMLSRDDYDNDVDKNKKISYFQKLPRRHMKYINEYFTSKYNGRRWHHDVSL